MCVTTESSFDVSMILVHHEERTLAAAADNDTLEARFDVVLFAILSSFFVLSQYSRTSLYLRSYWA